MPSPKHNRPSYLRNNDSVVEGYPSLRWSQAKGWSPVPEELTVEAPLAIELSFERRGQAVTKVLAVTMRTPGADAELALGFLFAEGLVADLSDIKGTETREQNSRGEALATVRVALERAPREDLETYSRGWITNSACGVCGRSTLEGLPFREALLPADFVPLAGETIVALPEQLRLSQACFARTGGTHGAGLFDWQGRLLLAREDVGRHNAVDKLIGAALQGKISPKGMILVLSGRVSFELIQKAAAAGIIAVVAVGAPSSIAVDVAHLAGITLIGFARDARFNVYTHAARVQAGNSSGKIVPQAKPA